MQRRLACPGMFETGMWGMSRYGIATASASDWAHAPSPEPRTTPTRGVVEVWARMAVRAS
jgi:hypothetical protein